MPDDTKPILICMVGIPRSGKSTWARSGPYPIVNKDSIRLALHGERYLEQAEPMVQTIAKIMVESLFLAGHKAVILDETNVTRERRNGWLSAKWNTVFKVIETPVEECLRRAEGDDAIIPIIHLMNEQWEPLGADEAIYEEALCYA